MARTSGNSPRPVGGTRRGGRRRRERAVAARQRRDPLLRRQADVADARGAKPRTARTRRFLSRTALSRRRRQRGPQRVGDAETIESSTDALRALAQFASALPRTLSGDRCAQVRPAPLLASLFEELRAGAAAAGGGSSAANPRVPPCTPTRLGAHPSRPATRAPLPRLWSAGQPRDTQESDDKERLGDTPRAGGRWRGIIDDVDDHEALMIEGWRASGARARCDARRIDRRAAAPTAL